MSVLISAVICTHNRAGYLVKAIQSLVDQRMPKDQYEIIVVDNCSTDSTRTVVEGFAGESNLRYLYEPTLGLSFARNAGWHNARGQYVAYLDDDGVACPVWLKKIIEAFETVKPRPGCVGGKTEPLWEAPRPSWLSDQLITGLAIIDWADRRLCISDLTQQWLVGVNIAFPTEILRQVGGFALGLDRAGKNLLSNGDVFLEQQILRAGYPCLYDPEILVGHHIQASRLAMSWFIRRYYWQGISNAAMQLLEESPSAMRRVYLAGWKVAGLLRSPQKLMTLILPAKDSTQFTRKCFAMISVGHIVGLLGAVRR